MPNVALIDPTAHEASPEHKIGVVLHTASSAILTLQTMSEHAEYRDLMTKEIDLINDLQLVLLIVRNRVEAREAA